MQICDLYKNCYKSYALKEFLEYSGLMLMTSYFQTWASKQFQNYSVNYRMSNEFSDLKQGYWFSVKLWLQF